MFNFWNLWNRAYGAVGGWRRFARLQRHDHFQGGSGVVQAQVQSGRTGGINTKLWVCGVSLAIIIIGWLYGRDPSQLEIVVPSIIVAYCGARAYTDGVVIRNQNNGTDSSANSADIIR